MLILTALRAANLSLVILKCWRPSFAYAPTTATASASSSSSRFSCCYPQENWVFTETNRSTQEHKHTGSGQHYLVFTGFPCRLVVMNSHNNNNNNKKEEGRENSLQQQKSTVATVCDQEGVSRRKKRGKIYRKKKSIAPFLPTLPRQFTNNTHTETHTSRFFSLLLHD